MSERGAPALVQLDRALRPIRRTVQYALRPGARARYVEANLERHLHGVLELELPAPLHEELEALARQLEGFDLATTEEQRQRLSAVYAELARIDAVAGLPLAPESLRPVKKPIQRDEPEARADTPSTADREATASKRERARAPRPPPIKVDLGTPLEELWPAEVAAVGAAEGLETVADVLALEPVGIEELEVLAGGGAEPTEGRVALGGRLGDRFTVVRPGGEQVACSWLHSGRRVRVQWAHGVARTWQRSDPRVVLAGTLTADGLVGAEVVAADEQRARLARYGIEGIDDALVRGVVTAWVQHGGGVRDPITAPTLQRLNLPSRTTALAGAHVGDERARRRMAFDEALLVQLAGFLARGRGGRGLGHAVVHGFAGRLGQVHDLFLDDAQQAVFEDVKRDLRAGAPMRRVLTGEVGGGRGLVALMAAAQVAEGRAQVMILADDEVGAATRFLHSEPLLREGQITARLVPSPPTGSQREAIKRGETQVVFGTVELLEQSIEFRRLGLVVVVERSRWGRAGLACDTLSAPHPDLLVVPSVPVGPRLLFTAYAGYDVSELVDRERQAARITVCHAGHRARAYAQLREVVARGEQAVVVFPMVRDRDALDVRGALRLVRALEDELLQGISVGLDHGGMPSEERRRVHDDFVHRRLQVLLSTTRIEEGPRAPGASLVIVEQADSMEAWRLHRIIGFMSRRGASADAILVAGDLATEEAIVALRRLQEAPSGVALTELRVASEGAVAADGVAPMPDLAWLDVDRDLELVLAARDEAQRIVRADPSLRRGAHPELARQLLQRWSTLWPQVDEGTPWAPPRLDPDRSEGGGGSRKRRRRRRKHR